MPRVVPVCVSLELSLEFEMDRETPVFRVVPVPVLALWLPMLRLPELEPPFVPVFEPSRASGSASSSSSSTVATSTASSSRLPVTSSPKACVTSDPALPNANAAISKATPATIILSSVVAPGMNLSVLFMAANATDPLLHEQSPGPG